MRGNDAFSEYHPVVNFIYFALVLGFSMYFTHPVCIACSFTAALLYARKVSKGRTVKSVLLFLIPSVLMIAVINPAFNHRGTTVLGFLPGGNPLTLESILYGFCAGVMFAAVLLWFTAFTSVMTEDKFIYLFGKIIPSLSLILSMALRFVPLFKSRLDDAKTAQANIGVGRKSRVKSAMTAFSATVTWSLENAVDTADSMKSRGYGLKGRTAFSIYTFTKRDRYALIWLCFCGIYIICGALAGGLFWRWYPTVRGVLTEPLSVSVLTVFLALCLSPLILDGHEERIWKRARNRMKGKR